MQNTFERILYQELLNYKPPNPPINVPGPTHPPQGNGHFHVHKPSTSGAKSSSPEKRPLNSARKNVPTGGGSSVNPQLGLQKQVFANNAYKRSGGNPSSYNSTSSSGANKRDLGATTGSTCSALSANGAPAITALKVSVLAHQEPRDKVSPYQHGAGMLEIRAQGAAE